MSLASIDPLTPQPTAPARALRPAPEPHRGIQPAQPAQDAPRQSRRLHAVPQGPQARGFALYVGFDELKAAENGTSLGKLVEALKELTAELAPGSEAYAAVALAPEGVGGRDVDVVRLALQEPAAVAKHHETDEPTEDDTPHGVIVDVSRKRVLLDGETATLTFKEFELLQYLVLREGRTIERSELITALWNSRDEEVPNERTIDVHVRRLRSKLGVYEDIVRTVRGVGYRFDTHADVSVRHASAPSPDLF